MAQTGGYCYTCQQMRLFRTEEMNHTPHILASIFLCGLWLPIWIIIAATHNPPWLCSFCGSPMMEMVPIQQPKRELPPQLQMPKQKQKTITSIFDE